MKMKSLSIIAISLTLLITSFFIQSCSDSKNNDEMNSPSSLQIDSSLLLIKQRDDSLLIPLAEGNEWIFDVSYQDMATGTMLKPNDEFPFPTADTLYVHGSTELDGNPCSLIRTLAVPKGGTWYTNRAKGMYSWPQDPDDTTSTPVFSLTYKYPATKGETYTANGVSVEVKDTAASITVPAGTFKCFYYYSVSKAPGGGSFENFVWLAKGIGMIRNEAIMRSKGVEPVRRIVALRRFTHAALKQQ